MRLCRRILLALGLTACLAACQAPPASLPPAGQPLLRLQLRLRSSFHIQSPRQPDQVAAIRYCLLEHPTGVSPAGGQNLEPVGPVFSYALNQPPPLELRFSHLRANRAGKSYSLAVAAIDAEGRNITNASGDNASQGRVTIAGETGNFALSSSGGDPDNPGSVRVTPQSYALSGSEALGLTLKLLDG